MATTDMITSSSPSSGSSSSSSFWDIMGNWIYSSVEFCYYPNETRIWDRHAGRVAAVYVLDSFGDFSMYKGRPLGRRGRDVQQYYLDHKIYQSSQACQKIEKCLLFGNNNNRNGEHNSDVCRVGISSSTRNNNAAATPTFTIRSKDIKRLNGRIEKWGYRLQTERWTEFINPIGLVTFVAIFVDQIQDDQNEGVELESIMPLSNS